MKRKQLTAMISAMLLTAGLAVTSLLAQGGEKGKQPTLGKVKEATQSVETTAAKKYGYTTQRGAFLVQNGKPGKGMTCFISPSDPQEGFYEVSLKYLRWAQTDGGFYGPYFETKAGSTTFRILFSYNTSQDGTYVVVYADENDVIFNSFPALCRAEKK